jgi:hypothetical protein
MLRKKQIRDVYDSGLGNHYRTTLDFTVCLLGSDYTFPRRLRVAPKTEWHRLV